MERQPGPSHYIRQIGALEKTADVCAKWGKKPLLVGGEKSLQAAGNKIIESFNATGYHMPEPVYYGGECCEENIQAVVDACNSAEADLLIAVGGGKALDTVKAAAFRLKVPVVTVPTIAATCAAWTPLSIIYDQKGKFVEICYQAAMPAAILVDTEIIAQAPSRYLVAGMGDTLAKWYESEITTRNKPYSAVLGLAKGSASLCYRLILQYGGQAVEAVNQQMVNQALEEVIDAIILLSGTVSCMGGDDCRCAAAHAVYSGLTGVAPVHAKSLHGEMVAFGILVQLMLEGKEEEGTELIAKYRRLLLPCTLKELGLTNCTEQDMEVIVTGTLATEDIENMPFLVTEVMLEQAILAADHLGQILG